MSFTVRKALKHDMVAIRDMIQVFCAIFCSKNKNGMNA